MPIAHSHITENLAPRESGYGLAQTHSSLHSIISRRRHSGLHIAAEPELRPYNPNPRGVRSMIGASVGFPAANLTQLTL